MPLVQAGALPASRATKPNTWSRLSVQDRIAIGLLGFYVLIAFTIELYWIIYRGELMTRANTEFFAKLFAIYAAGDREYFDIQTPLPMALEAFNVFFTQILNVLIVWAIVHRRWYRHPLQLLVSSYVAYSVVLYFLTAHFFDYASMGQRNAWGFFIFIAPNLPWLLGYMYLAYQSFTAYGRALATPPPPADAV